MKIAISTDGDFVSAHFGRCPSFTIIDIDGEEIKERFVVANPGHQPGFIPQFLHEKGAKTIVCGGMGMRAISIFEEYGIKTVVGISGKVDDVIDQIKKGTLKGGESLCKPSSGKGYGLEKEECDHPHEEDCKH